jgi:hypothetical protein
MSFGEMMDHYLNTDDTKEPQSAPCIWNHQPVCWSCHSNLTKHSDAAVITCMRKKRDLKTGAWSICGAANRIEGS